MIQKGVTFVVQGPLTPETIRGIYNYKKLGKVIVSCWDTGSDGTDSTRHKGGCK